MLVHTLGDAPACALVSTPSWLDSCFLVRQLVQARDLCGCTGGQAGPCVNRCGEEKAWLRMLSVRLKLSETMSYTIRIVQARTRGFRAAQPPNIISLIACNPATTY